jgi:hypothetical protein
MTNFDATSVRLAKQLTSAPASGPVVSWRAVHLVAGSNLEKYSLTAASDSASDISNASLSHERGPAKAWLARQTAETRAKKYMVANYEGGTTSRSPRLYHSQTLYQAKTKIKYSPKDGA